MKRILLAILLILTTILMGSSVSASDEVVLFEDNFDDLSQWNVYQYDSNHDGQMNVFLEQQDGMIHISTGAEFTRDRIELQLWKTGSPIDVNNHTYQIIWRARTGTDNCRNLMEIWVNNKDKDRILYDYGGYEVPYYRDQISVKVGSSRHNEYFEHWGDMETSEWSVGSIIFGQGTFLALNDRFGDGELYLEADNSEAFAELGCLTTINPGIYIKTAAKGQAEEWWFDWIKVIQLDGSPPEVSTVMINGEIEYTIDNIYMPQLINWLEAHSN